ncbi:Tripartite tricarboxylate transporter family receptor [Pigmentiphaga humi]|uniref:Tripartite tricarboxylate transporter family receptor n=1 Tax=Pigmentiphaga humi TaxID=2478468 RepID=A0A3P4B7R8_9BURK|nr:tripartite tricarboxylate transporter substrate binding protein [Pigmentiphaga humi]VCU71728.1 Tripartite tricarboxylate transporter family receptor [Pigmentiphaga humi]
MLKRHALRASALALALAAIAPAVHAQSAADYPSRPIRIIVPYTPGAINDVLARRIAQKLSESLKQTVVVENKPGGGTVIGTEYVARAEPDGYTLLQTAASHSINPSLVAKLPYDSIKSFSFISLVGTSPYVMIATPNLPANTIPELVALAKAKPGTISYASTGNGGSAHLMGEMLKDMAKIDLMHVPYKGLAQGLNDLSSGQVQLSFSTYTGAMAFLKPGRVKALAVTGQKRMDVLPDVPAIAETYPGYDASGWWGYVAPAGTPQPIVDKLNRELNKVVQAPEFREQFKSEGVQMLGTTPDEFRAHVEREMDTWGKLVKKVGIRMD